MKRVVAIILSILCIICSAFTTYAGEEEKAILKPGNSWTDNLATEVRESIEKIVIQSDPYTGEYTQTEKADNKNEGSINLYILEEDNTNTLILAGDGSGSIKCNPDSSSLFKGFESVEEIEGLEILDTSNVTNMSEMFQHCASLESLDVSSFNTSQVTDMSYMFNCASFYYKGASINADVINKRIYIDGYEDTVALKSLELGNMDTSQVTNMDHMFAENAFLEELNVSSFNTSKVTNMRDMFSVCNSLESLDVTNFDTSSVTNMSGMFSAFGGKSLDLSSFNTSKVVDMSNMFSATDIEDLDISHFDMSHADTTNMWWGTMKWINEQREGMGLTEEEPEPELVELALEGEPIFNDLVFAPVLETSKSSSSSSSSPRSSGGSGGGGGGGSAPSENLSKKISNSFTKSVFSYSENEQKNMVTNIMNLKNTWALVSDGNTAYYCYLDINGHKLIGWQTIGGIVYYFNELGQCLIEGLVDGKIIKNYTISNEKA